MEVTTDIPLPEVKSPGGQVLKFPWDEMVIGSSFFVESEGRNMMSFRSKLHRRGMDYFYRRGELAKFKTRTVTEDGVKGVRIWRVA